MADHVQAYREHLVAIQKAIHQRFGSQAQVPDRLTDEIHLITELFHRMGKHANQLSLDEDFSIGLKTSLIWRMAQIQVEMNDLLAKGAIEEMLSPSAVKHESIREAMEMSGYQQVPTRAPLEETDFIKETPRTVGPLLEEVPKKKEGFVIMQIGNPEMDSIWETVFKPTIKNSGLLPRRVDKHDDGRLLKQQIIEYLNYSQIVIADLTNERPNCYLEVGYVMGQNRYRDLILCCRKDHHKDNVKYKKGGPKVHFDLEGYSIVWWDPKELQQFSVELEERIRRRIGKISPFATSLAGTPPPKKDIKQWMEEQRKEVFKK